MSEFNTHKTVEKVGTKEEAIAYARMVLSNECRKLGFIPDQIDWLQAMIDTTMYIIANPLIPGMGGRRNVEYEFDANGYFINKEHVANAYYPQLIATVQFEDYIPMKDRNRFYPEATFKRDLDRFERLYRESSPSKAYHAYKDDPHAIDGSVSSGISSAVYAPWVDAPRGNPNITEEDIPKPFKPLTEAFGIDMTPDFDQWIDNDNRRGER